jgi:hypothetical protein
MISEERYKIGGSGSREQIIRDEAAKLLDEAQLEGLLSDSDSDGACKRASKDDETCASRDLVITEHSLDGDVALLKRHAYTSCENDLIADPVQC